MPKISFIIPCYNVEKYISECLDSILNQNFTDFEILCINDGSTDSTLEILDKYRKNDVRILVIDQDNQGQSVARNVGIEQAHGEWIWFVDSDDCIEENCLYRISELIHDNEIDLISFMNSYIFETEEFERSTDKVHRYGEYKLIYNGTELYSEFKKNNEWYVAPWRYVINTKFLRNSTIKFYPGIFAEDMLFSTDMFFSAKSILVSKESFYKYRVRENSTLTSSRWLWKSYSEVILYKELEKLKSKYKLSDSCLNDLDDALYGRVKMAIDYYLKYKKEKIKTETLEEIIPDEYERLLFKMAVINPSKYIEKKNSEISSLKKRIDSNNTKQTKLFSFFHKNR